MFHLHGVLVISSEVRNLAVTSGVLLREISPYGRNDGGGGLWLLHSLAKSGNSVSAEMNFRSNAAKIP